jgi:hypothetical protein
MRHPIAASPQAWLKRHSRAGVRPTQRHRPAEYRAAGRGGTTRPREAAGSAPHRGALDPRHGDALLGPTELRRRPPSGQLRHLSADLTACLFGRSSPVPSLPRPDPAAVCRARKAMARWLKGRPAARRAGHGHESFSVAFANPQEAAGGVDAPAASRSGDISPGTVLSESCASRTRPGDAMAEPKPGAMFHVERPPRTLCGPDQIRRATPTLKRVQCFTWNVQIPGR